MPYIRQDEDGRTIGYAIAPPSAEVEWWIRVDEDDLRVTAYLNPTEPITTLERAIAQTQTAIQNHALFLLEAAVEGYSSVERDTWFGKESEAIKYKASNDPNDAPYLSIEAEAAGIPLSAIATIVIDKATALKLYTSYVLGNRAFHYRTVAAYTTIEQVLEYDFSGGWAA